jgi:capsule polysaccharide export protein KpsE/RkpR
MTQEQVIAGTHIIAKIESLQKSIDLNARKIHIEPLCISTELLKNEIAEFQDITECLWIDFADKKIQLLNAELEAL